MTYIAKPKVHHPALPKNAIGLTRRDYEGSITTLCAGCGHDSITAAIIQAFWDLSIRPHHVAKLSGIGCSSKTPAYFLREAHGFNGVHGRMPTLVTGANAANRDVIYIGISGDGDSLSIGLGHLCHAIRRNVNVLYVLENNGVYGLTKGQFSASADAGSLSKKGEANTMQAIDGCLLALSLGATFVARSFSGDKAQLVPILKAAISHRGFAFVDVISPCVTFNDHEGSTKSYAYTREKNVEVVQADFVPPASRDHGRLRARIRPQRDAARWQLGAAAQGRRGLRSHRPRPRVFLHPGSTTRRGAGDRPAASVVGFARPPRSERNRRYTPDAAALRRPVSRERGARQAAEGIQVGAVSSQLSAISSPGPFGIETGPGRPSYSTPRPAWARRRWAPRERRGIHGVPATRARKGGRRGEAPRSS